MIGVDRNIAEVHSQCRRGSRDHSACVRGGRPSPASRVRQAPFGGRGSPRPADDMDGHELPDDAAIWGLIAAFDPAKEAEERSRILGAPGSGSP